MNVSHAWLRQFVPVAPEAPAVADLLTARCATVEEVVRLGADLSGVVVGRVAEAARHPNSDHLWVTRVDAGGDELLDVVCGAPNVKAGARYPFAPVGTVLPGGLKLERRKIRGELSNGMLCSARELGLGQEHDGILELDTDAAPGTPFTDVLSAGDTRIVVDVLPNRPDLLSHLGVAREVAAAIDGEVQRPAELGDVVTLPWEIATADEARVGEMRLRVEPDARTPLYLAVVVRGVRVGPSPQWLVERLESVGSRSINNVVDATNYVLHAYGQPTHAFDLARLGGGAVVVRGARDGERLVTLDGVERTLRAGMTVIADAERAHAVAGVMGGGDSEVGEGTTDVLLEIARFDPKQVRQTRRALGLSTDASYRFERGIDPSLPERAAAELVALVLTVAGGRVDGAGGVRAETPAAPKVVELRPARVTRLLGVPLTAERIVVLLAGIGFVAEPAGDLLRVPVPGWRLDVEREVDLIEEVARLHGYDALPDEIRPFRPSAVPDAPLVAVSERVLDALTAAGLFEARPLPFVPARGDERVPVLNPLAENEGCLRTSVLDTLARRAEHNLAHLQGNVRLFEIGTVFTPSGERLPAEALHVGVLVMGERRPVHFSEPRPPRYDAWDAKALAERVARAGYPGRHITLAPSSVEGELWTVCVDGDALGRVTPVALDAPEWAAPAFGIELRLGDVREGARPGSRPAAPRYVPLPTTPPAVFDLALLVPEGTGAAQVEAAIRSATGELLERLELFDEYRGAGVPAGQRSLAWRLTFRHPERTLRDKEIEGRRTKLLRALQEELGVTAR